MAGLWRVSFSFEAWVYAKEQNFAYLYHNGQKMGETQHKTYTGYDAVVSTGGRDVMVRAQKGDTLHLGTSIVDNTLFHVNVCYHFMSF